MREERLRFIVFIIDENDTSDYTQIAPSRVVSFLCGSVFAIIEWTKAWQKQHLIIFNPNSFPFTWI